MRRQNNPLPSLAKLTLIPLLSLTFLLLCAGTIQAGTNYMWIGPSGNNVGDWSNSQNWKPNGPMGYRLPEITPPSTTVGNLAPSASRATQV